MELEGNTLVLLILSAALGGVGVQLYFWSQRQSDAIKEFAASRGLIYHAVDPGQLEYRVNQCVALDEPDMTRTFSQLGDVVPLPNGTLFRAVELLDLTPWGRAEYVNQSRAAVFLPFPSTAEYAGIYMVSRALSVHQRYPASPSRVDAVKALLESVRMSQPPCALSLTLMRGCVVAYLEPLVSGSVSRKQLDYLADLAERLSAI